MPPLGDRGEQQADRSTRKLTDSEPLAALGEDFAEALHEHLPPPGPIQSQQVTVVAR